MIAKGYNPDYGARPLRRAIENMIENPLSEEILRGSFTGKNTIIVEVEGEGEGDSKRLKFQATTKQEAQGHALAGVGGAAETRPGPAGS